MDNKFLYAMAKFDAKTENILKEIQESIFLEGIIGKQTPNFPAHITLGTFKTNKEEEMKNRIVTISKQIKKIPVSFDNIGLFGMDVLFISPSTNYELLDLRKEFKADCINSFNWVPHVTMIYDEPNNIQKSVPILAKNFTPFSGFIDRISLYEFYPNRFIIEKKLSEY